MPNKPFDNKLYIVDYSGFLWTTTDAAEWSRGSAPVCSTTQVRGGAFFPAVGTQCPPELFVDNGELLLQAFPGTAQDSALLVTADAIHWTTSSMAFQQSYSVYDYATVDGVLFYCGYNWIPSELGTWVGKEKSGAVHYLPSLPYTGNGGKYGFNCEGFKGALLFCGQNSDSLWIWDAAVSQWYSCRLPASMDNMSLVTF